MGSESSAQQDIARSGEEEEEDATSNIDTKSLQKNGQISSKTSLSGRSEDNTLAGVGQPDGVSVAQKEDNSETMETIADEQAAQVNGEKLEKEAPEANDVTPVEEKATDEKPDETGEVGFKKIFRFGGFKFTLKKDKSEEKDPVKLLTVKDKDGEAVDGSDETPAELENGIVEEKVSPAAETEVAAKDTDHDGETANGVADAAETADEAVKDEVSEKEAESSPPPQETALSPFRKLFSTGLFSNLRKKSSIKRTKEEEEKEAAVQGEAAKTEDGGDKPEAEPDSKEDATVCQEKEKTQEETPASAQEPKPEPASDSEATSDSPASDEPKPEEEEKSPVEVTSDSELVSSQEKAKSQGSPLKKLFNGTGLKKRSSKSKKGKKDTEAKLTESGEQSTELQSSTESAEAAKAESGASSSPEKSGERPAEAEGAQAEDAEGEVVSDGEKKKEGVVVWSSFKKLVTPKKRVKRPSESDDEVTAEKAAKSATLSSSESAPLADGGVEEEETKEAKEEKPCEGENAQEKLLSSTEEPKKKMDTSVSWEALMCMGGPKKRTRKTSDSDDEETKIEEESAPAAEDGKREEKNEEAPENPQNAETDGEASPAPETAVAPERESAWDTLKRMVMPKNKAKSEEKAEESAADQVQAESELPKDESSFSLRKLFPGLRKKKVEKQASTESEEDSDTPAVVPLSEYDTQQEVVREEPAATEETATLAEVASEERTPSWIAATVDQGDEQHDQLSDITEEAENVATPKSVDTDNVEDESEEVAPPKPPGRRLSIAEIAQAPSAETTSNETQGPKTEEARESLAPVEAQMGEIPAVTTPICQDPPVVSAAEEFEAPLEQAVSKTNHLFESHAREEAVAICTGLGTKEIAKVALEKPASPITECLSVVTHALTTTELLVQDDACELGKAVATQDALLNAQVQQERSAEIDQVGISEELIADVQTAAATREPEPPSAEVGSTLQAVEDAVTPAADFNNGDVEKDQRQALACETVAPSQEACIIKECTVLVSPPSSEPEDAANEEDSQKIEAQSSVIAQSVIQDAVDKVSVGAKSPESATPIKAVQAEMTTEKKTYFAASEYETLPIEVAEILQPSVLGEGKPEVGLKNAVEVDASEELLVEEQAVEMGGNIQTNSKLEAVEEEMEEEKKIRVPVQVVLQTAQVMEGESVEEEALEEIASNGLTDGDRSEEERTPSKCAEVMAQVMEVIEEAVKEIQPASSTEITPAS